MGIFYYFDDNEINFNDLKSHVKDEYSEYFGREELNPYLLSEICALDMLHATMNMNEGYYKKRLVLKGGHSVRNLVSLVDHRFSFDADFNLNSPNDFTYGDVSDLKKDLTSYGSIRNCTTGTQVTNDTASLYFLEVKYRDVLKKKGHIIIEPPKIEICKTCRTLTSPVESEMQTMIDLELLGLKPPKLFHLSLEEQLANKLFVIGANGRQRNNFDAYDVYRICLNNKINWKLEKRIYETIVVKSKNVPKKYTENCRHQLDTMLTNPNKQKNLTKVLFNADSFDFNKMIEHVKSVYDFK